MAKINDGGAAFPCEGGSVSGLIADPGMSLRDYFAAAALQGMLNSKALVHLNTDVQTAKAYEYADAMLTAREVTE